MKKYLFVEMDENDADYISTLQLITDEELEVIKPVIAAIKKNNNEDNPGGGWEYLTGERVEGEGSGADEKYGEIEGYNIWEQFVPWSEYGVHTLHTIDIYHVESVDDLLKD